MKRQQGKLIIHASKESIESSLHSLIHESFERAMSRVSRDRDRERECPSSSFYIALSGGSLPSFLASLPQSFIDANIDPQWEKWHVLLADERLVPSTHQDSNLGALMDTFLNKVPIPRHQIYGINEDLLQQDMDFEDVQIVAADYQSRVFGPSPFLSTFKTSLGQNSSSFLIDCALLGFGPDGHTCSLFPGHALLDENQLLVAGIHDSPKPPPNRITLTFRALNQYTRDVIFVGAGESKKQVLNSIFHDVYSEQSCANNTFTCTSIRSSFISNTNIRSYHVEMKDSNIYPFGMVQPRSNSLYYIVDQEAAGDIHVNNRFNCAML